MPELRSRDLDDRRLHDWQTVNDVTALYPGDIGSFEDKGVASPGDGHRFREPDLPSSFRQQLGASIGSIRRRQGPTPEIPQPIGLECLLDSDQLSSLQSLIGECNDATFCGADPGQLTLVRRIRSSHDVRGRFEVTVHFEYAGSRSVAPGGRRTRVQQGADFAGHLP